MLEYRIVFIELPLIYKDNTRIRGGVYIMPQQYEIVNWNKGNFLCPNPNSQYEWMNVLLFRNVYYLFNPR